MKGAEKRELGFADRTCASQLRPHHVELEEPGLKEGRAWCQFHELGEVFGVLLEDRDEIWECRVVHDLLVLPLIPIDGLLALLGCYKALEHLLGQALAIPIIAIHALQHLTNGDAELAEDLGNDAIGIDVLFQPIHLWILPTTTHYRGNRDYHGR